MNAHRLPFALALLLLASAARAGEHDHCAQHPAPTAASTTTAGAAITFPDAALVDQDGAPVRLASEGIGDGIVVMDFIFTSCTTVCPLLSGIMKGVQDEVGGAPDVRFLSVTVDPARDTPGRLREHATRWGAGPRWRFLTGEPDEVRRVLEAAGAWTADFTAHPPMVLVGDGQSGKWVRLNGFPKRARVMAEIESLRERRRGGGTAALGGRP